MNDAAEPRIVSLLPSATEIVCLLGGAPQLVGISHECDFPAEIRDRPVLTSSRIRPGGSSREIDTAVREVFGGASSIYAVDERRLTSLRPDVIVTQDLCEVCAVSLDDVRAAVARLAHRDDVRIVSLHPTRLADVLDDVERVGTGIGREDEGRLAREELERRIRSVADRAAQTERRPRVVTLEWLDPVMLGGTWMPELIELAGGVPVGAKAGELAPTVSLDELRELAPDVVLAKPCGFSLERTLAERTALARIAEALPDEVHLYVTDGNAYFNRPGPRLVESLQILAACVSPDRFEDLRREHAAVVVPWPSDSR